MIESFDTSSVDSKVPRKRGFVRLMMWIACLVPVLAGISLWVVTRSWFLILVTAPGLERQLGADVRIGDASYYGNGRLVFKDVIITCPGITGPAGQAARIGRAEIVIDPTTLLSGVIVREIQLDDLLLRISENRRNPGQFNFSSFRPRWDRKQESLRIGVDQLPRPAKHSLEQHAFTSAQSLEGASRADSPLSNLPEGPFDC